MCAFQVLPDPPNGPIEIPSHKSSDPLVFPELTGGAPLRMFIRVVRLSKDGHLVGGPDPEFALSAANGALTPPLPKMSANAQTAPIISGNRVKVAEAGWVVEPLDTFLVTVDVSYTGSTPWALQITNRDDETRHFVAVVGDNDGPDDGARQPWLHAPPSLSFSARADVTGPLSRQLRIENRGTAPLTIESRGLTAPFEVLAPEPIEPNTIGYMTTICTPGEIDSATRTLTLISNDGAARASAGHNNVVAVTFNRTQDNEDGGDDPPPPPGCQVPGCGCRGVRSPLDHNNNCGRCHHGINMHYEN